MFEFNPSLFSLPPFFIGVLILVIGLFAFNTNRRATINKVFLCLCLSVFVWTSCYALVYSSTNKDLVLFVSRLGFLGVAFIPMTSLHFILELIRMEGRSRVLICGYFLSFLCVPVFFTEYFFTDVYYYDWGPYPKAGEFYIVFFVYFSVTFFVCVSLLLWELLKGRKRESLSYRNQIKYVFLGFFIASISCVDYIPNYGYDIYPFAYLCAFGWISCMSYAITRHRLMDIQIIIKRTLVFAGLVAFVFGVFSFATFLIKELLGGFFGENNFWVNGISIFLIVLGYDPIRRWLVVLTDKYFFQKKYDYQKLLKDASRGISKIESLHRLLSLVVHFITMKMRVKNAAILSHVKDTGSFKIEFQRGYNKNFFEYSLPSDDELLKFLNGEHEAIDLQRIEQYIEAGNVKQEKGQDPRRYDFDAIKKTMKELDVVCCVPSYLGKELRNILMLGEKKSGDYFVEQDLNVLYTLAQESAIAIENARLYDEAINKSSELEDINGQLEYAKDLLMKALRDTEVANKQLQDTQAQLIHEQKMATLGRLAASVGHEVNNPLTILSMNVSRVLLKLRKNPDLKVTEIMDTFDKMEQNIGRIKAVVNTLTGLLKKSEKGKFEPLSLKLILEETLPLVQFQTYLDNLTGTEVEFDIPGNIPLIRGDLERLQEVFLNLFINAYHAMEGKQHRKIRVHAEIDPEDTDMVAIRFRDNGKGMDEETQKKIFNYRFTTKGPGKGSGLGLYMCKYIIELHGGAINVYSKLGEGTSFVIHLPSVDKKIEAKGLPSDLEQSYQAAQEDGPEADSQASAG